MQFRGHILYPCREAQLHFSCTIMVTVSCVTKLNYALIRSLNTVGTVLSTMLSGSKNSTVKDPIVAV